MQKKEIFKNVAPTFKKRISIMNSRRAGLAALVSLSSGSLAYISVWNYPAPFERQNYAGNSAGNTDEADSAGSLRYFWKMPWFARLDYFLWDFQSTFKTKQFVLSFINNQIDSVNVSKNIQYLWRAYETIKDSDEGAISPMATDALVFTVSQVFAPLLEGCDLVPVNEVDLQSMETSLELLLKKPHVGESISEELKRLRLALNIGHCWLTFLQQKIINNPLIINGADTTLSGISTTLPIDATLSDAKSLDKERKWRSKYVLIDQKLPLYLPYEFRESFHAMVAKHTH